MARLLAARDGGLSKAAEQAFHEALSVDRKYDLEMRLHFRVHQVRGLLKIFCRRVIFFLPTLSDGLPPYPPPAAEHGSVGSRHVGERCSGSRDLALDGGARLATAGCYRRGGQHGVGVIARPCGY